MASLHVNDYEFDCRIDGTVGIISLVAEISADINYYYDPGCMYMPNGDPGYPPESDWERTSDLEVEECTFCFLDDGSGEPIFEDCDISDLKGHEFEALNEKTGEWIKVDPVEHIKGVLTDIFDEEMPIDDDCGPDPDDYEDYNYDYGF